MFDRMPEPQDREAENQARRSASQARDDEPTDGESSPRAHGQDASGPLDAGIRAVFEPRLEHDLSGVRIHADAGADASARAAGAAAYTLGHDIYFGRGRYAPDSRSGRSLLAHELTHVVQQDRGFTRGLQRAPDQGDDAGVGAPAPAVDPDANEAAARVLSPGLARMDSTGTPQQNEAAVRSVVLEAFGGEDGVNTAFEGLSPSVISAVDKYAGSGPGGRTANRIQFFVRMRLYFSSWAALLTHFSSFVRVSRQPSVDVILHRDAASRLERVLNLLASQGHPLPVIGEGFSLRGFHQGEFQTPGYMIHALGFAIDVAAAENPKIAFRNPGGGASHDPAQIASSIDPARATIDMGASNPAVILAMGQRTASTPDLSAAQDTDPAAHAYFTRFTQQFEQMTQGSLGFLGSMSAKHRDALLALRQDYFGVLTSLAAEQKKGSAANPQSVLALQMARVALLRQIPALTNDWVAAIDREIHKTFAAHPGMEAMRAPVVVSAALRTAQAALAAAARDASLARASAVRAMAGRDAASAALKQAEQLEKHAAAGPAFTKALAAVQTARTRFQTALEEVVQALSDEMDVKTVLQDATGVRDTLATELKRSDDPALHNAWNWISSLRSLQQSMVNPNLTTATGIKEYEQLMTGDLKHQAPVDNPPLLRLLEAGFFNPKGGFDLAFFEEMAHSGFWPGATWGFGGADPMHFELVEGRQRIQSPGQFPRRLTP